MLMQVFCAVCVLSTTAFVTKIDANQVSVRRRASFLDVNSALGNLTGAAAKKYGCHSASSEAMTHRHSHVVAAHDQHLTRKQSAGLATEKVVFAEGGAASAKSKLQKTRISLYNEPGTCAIVAALGVAMMSFGAISIKRSKREIAMIEEMEAAETTAGKLLETLKSGQDLPSVVIVKGVLSSSGEDVMAASPSIPGLSGSVGTIEQPKNALLEIARWAKRGDDDGKLTSIVEKETGLKPDDIPDVEDDFTSRKVDFKEAGCVLTETLIARVFCSTYKYVHKEKKKKEVEIKRTPRNQSYNVFHARNVSEGLYLADMQGNKMTLQLPDANIVKQVGLGEPPPLFLATADTSSEFFDFLRKDGLTVQGQHMDLSDMPPTTVGDPLTMLSKFIFMDVQSNNDLGLMGNNEVLEKLAVAYGRSASEGFLWEPKGFYDSDNNGHFFHGTTLATRELVSSQELLRRAKQAAQENSKSTGHCEPTFSRAELPRLRDNENCFRFTELAIPRDSPVTVLARPEPDGDGGIRLVPPNSAENGRDAADPDAERFRLRIISGYTIENLLKQRDLNIMQYYGIAVVGAFATLYAAAGCPGMS